MREMQDRILYAAKKQFGRFGFQKTTINDICKDAKVSKKTVYKYFKDKEDLFISLFIREALSAREAIFQGIEEVDDPLEKLEKLAVASLRYFKKESFMVNLIKDEEGLYSPYLNVKYHDLVEEEIVNIIAGILREGIKRGRFRRMNEQVVAYSIFKLFQAFTYARSFTLFEYEEEDGVEINELLNFVIKGIGSGNT